MAEEGDADATQTLLSSLADANWRIRHATAGALRRVAEHRGDEVVPLLVPLLISCNCAVRRTAVRALGEIAAAARVNSAAVAVALEALRPCLQDSDAVVRRSAATALPN